MTGAWVMEVAEEYPYARVIGMDLSPVQRRDVPSNCKFLIGDLTKDLAEFYNGSFDLVNSRYGHTPGGLIIKSSYGGYQGGSMAWIYKGDFPHPQSWNWMGTVCRRRSTLLGRTCSAG
jgi:hypothetical protein